MVKSRYMIIIVDDNVTNLTVARNAIADKHDVFTAPSGKKLFQLLEKLSPDLIILDVEMPEMNGYDVIKILKSNEKTAGIPVIFLTAKIDPFSEVEGLSLGAVDYITKPFSKELLQKRIEIHMLAETQRKELKHYSQDLEVMVSRKTHIVFGLQTAILKTVAELVESRDNITGGHIERTQGYLGLMISLLLENGIYFDELSSWDINLLIMSSQLHDVGKISIKDDILQKKGGLTDEEFEEMKKHTVYGMGIIEKIEKNAPESAFLKHAKVFAVSHHEKWDGTGYPNGLAGEDIPLQGRLMAIVDVYDALTNERPYKKAIPHKEAVEIIKHGIGTNYDPLLCDIFVRHEEKFEQLRCRISGEGDRQESGDIDWKAISQAVTAILDARAGTHNKYADRLQEYLKILIKDLLIHDRFKNEVLSWDISIFLLSAQLHDVGKIAVRDRVLHKTGKLTEEEFDEAKAHADFGVKVARHLRRDVDENSLLRHAELLAGSHHEKWDGSGYPLGLKGANIPLQGRIMAIVDVYDALTNDRPGRERLTHKQAVETIRGGSGTQFDPDLVAVFVRNEKEFEKVNDGR